MQFQLDTSGDVYVDSGPHKGQIFMWRNLTPFAQRYVGAMLQEVTTYLQPEFRPFAFSDLAPATLSRIIEDCERRRPRGAGFQTKLSGRLFWERRQSGELSDFSPLTVTLDNDGLIYFREVAQ